MKETRDKGVVVEQFDFLNDFSLACFFSRSKICVRGLHERAPNDVLPGLSWG